MEAHHQSSSVLEGLYHADDVALISSRIADLQGKTYRLVTTASVVVLKVAHNERFKVSITLAVVPALLSNLFCLRPITVSSTYTLIGQCYHSLRVTVIIMV